MPGRSEVYATSNNNLLAKDKRSSYTSEPDSMGNITVVSLDGEVASINFSSQTTPKIWLASDMVLHEQGCDSTTILFIEIKYWFIDEIQITDYVLLAVLYKELRKQILRSYVEIAHHDTLCYLAAINFKLQGQTYSKSLALINAKNIDQYIPSKMKKERRINDWYKNIGQYSYALSPDVYRTILPSGIYPLLLSLSPEGIRIYSKVKNQYRLKTFVSYGYLEFEEMKVPNGSNGTTQLSRGSSITFDPDENLKNDKKSAKLSVSHSYLSDQEIIGTNRMIFKLSLSTVAKIYNESPNHFLYINVQLKDRSVVKKMEYNMHTTPRELLYQFAQKAGLRNVDYFQLTICIDDCHKYLQMDDSMFLQGVHITSYLEIHPIEYPNDFEAFEYLEKYIFYLEIQDNFLKGFLLIKDPDAIQMAALTLVISSDSESIDLKNIDQNKLYPPLSPSEKRKKIFDAYNQTMERSKEPAIVKFLKIAQTSLNFGIIFYDGIIPKTLDKCYMGIGRNGCCEILGFYRFGFELREITNMGDTLKITVKASRNADEKHRLFK
ncbi:hypothetical protein ROZALSC1DRAFT_27319 [Rozella allomycis CSF55]|uniref:FERM domain-containing protein n=1 Tax=Rozella allomycis (strain CSF55) TaxID=988480 RepID=A0A4P9YNJ1_ROZAC|nr:hypothetical protein ROZALSC1DRAFT_27319 [Rozella allomycis CSF55]